MSEERLQRILARAGFASRRKAEELIREGRVVQDGRFEDLRDRPADPFVTQFVRSQRRLPEPPR